MDDKIIERCKTSEKQCMQEGLNRSRSCRAAIKQKPTSMDRIAIEHQSGRHIVSWWIENLSRSYQDKVQKARWIEITLTSIKPRRKRGSMLSVERCPKAIQKLKNSFSRREKHKYECNQACYTTKDSNNILSSQNHLSTRKMSSI